MGKKIRFPLEMDGGIEVRSLEELRDNFSINRVLLYLRSGKLVIWLRDRYENEIADSLEAIDTDSADIIRSLFEIFEVPYNEQEGDIEDIVEKSERIERLKKYTDDKKYFDNIDLVAFTQDDLYDLLDEGFKTIYLCGERFTIPISIQEITYVGINNPVAIINSKKCVDWEEKKIVIENMSFDEKYKLIECEEQRKETENKTDGAVECVYENMRLVVDTVVEDGLEVKILSMLDEEGNEIRISDNRGLSVVDYCESEEYVFYVLTGGQVKKSFLSDFWVKDTLCRYSKHSGENMVIAKDLSIGYHSPYSSSSRNECVDKNDNERSNGRISSSLRNIFCASKWLVFYENSKLWFCDFDGKNRRLISDIEGNIYIYWVYEDCVWYSVSNISSRTLYCYSIKQRKGKVIAYNSECLYTDGTEVFYIYANADAVTGADKRIVVQASMDAVSQKQYAVIKEKGSWGPGRIERIDGKLFVWDVKNKFTSEEAEVEQIEIEEGKTYTFAMR